ncbi:MAG: kinase [Clostridia bacterium]|nr:kinase [Clostridia bacterium]MBQ8368594.1 kinase [Clostridia bacterium]
MHTLIILRGNSGSGKTTLSKVLQEHFGQGTMRLSHDMVRMEILHTWGKEGVGQSLPLMTELLKYGRRHAQVTVLEGILPVCDYLPLFQTALEEYGSRIFAYYYNLSFEETLRRHMTKPNRNDFGEEQMRRWWREKDLIGIIPETIFTENMSLQSAAETVIRDVSAGQKI